MHDRKERVDDGVGVFPAQRRQDYKRNVAIPALPAGDVVRPAVHGNVMPAGGQAGAALLGKSLEAPVVGGDAARA